MDLKPDPPHLAARNVAELCHALEDGVRPKFLFFWSHDGPPLETPTAASLSQWYPAPFIIDGVQYLTAEHYMMVAKAELFGDDEARSRILDTVEPGAAKRFGRGVRGFDGSVWEQHRFDIVVTGNMAKFTQNESLGSFLAKTSKRVLAEASPVDRIWGIGLEESDPRAFDPNQWLGENLLGFALMEVRSRLRL